MFLIVILLFNSFRIIIILLIYYCLNYIILADILLKTHILDNDFTLKIPIFICFYISC